MTDRYSSLRQGLVGAWCPSLGATGYTLLDRTPFARSAVAQNIGTNEFRGAPGGIAAYIYDSFYDAGNVGSLTLAYPFAMSSWVYNLTTSVDCAAVGKCATGAGYPGAMQWISGGKLIAYWANGTRATSARTVTGVLAWQHLLIQWTGSTAEVWIDGALDASSATTTAPSAGSAPIRIGAYDGGRLGRGFLDDMRIYGRALTPSEIKLLASQRGIGLVPQRQRRANRVGSTLSINVGGTWRTATPWVNDAGVWKPATPSINVGGVWK